MTRKQLDQLFDDLNSDFTSEYGHVDNYMAKDIATDIINHETIPGIREVISEHYPDVEDQIIFVAENIIG